MKLKRGIIILMTALMLFCTMPEIALADEVTKPVPTVAGAAPEEEEFVPAAEKPAPEGEQPAPAESEPVPEAPAPAAPAPQAGGGLKSVLPAAAPVTLAAASEEDEFAIVALLDSDGNGLEGGVVSYYAGGWVNNAATTGSDGRALLRIPAGKIPTRVSITYKGATVTKNQNILDNPYCEFRTTKVAVRLLDSNGKPLEGGTAQYRAGGWRVFGDGKANSSMELLPGTYTFEAAYAGASQTQDVDIRDTDEEVEVVFQTTKVTVRLLDSKGNPLNGGTAQYRAGGWRVFGDGKANSSMELLPATYTFEVNYNGTGQVKYDVVISKGQENVVEFQTGAVILHYAGGKLQYYSGGWKSYTGTLEMLPVSTRFELQRSGWPAQYFYITPVAGQVYEKTLAVIRLVDSSGNGIQDGVVSYYDGSWHSLGNTDKDGIYLAQLDGNRTGSITFRMTLGGVYVQKLQKLTSDSFVLFQTRKVTFTLLDSTGKILEGTASYRDDSWHDFGDGTTGSTMELLPTNYTFKVGYLGATDQKIQNIGEDPNVVFQTKKVSFRLLTSDGVTELDGKASVRSNAWMDFGETGRTGGTMELLPVNHTFKVEYLGASLQKIQDVGKDPNVVFQTGAVILHYAGGTMRYRTDSWYSYNGALEMLPVSTMFQLQRDGWPTQTFNITPVAGQVYEKTLAVIRLVDSSGKGIKDGVASFYDGSWHPLGNTDDSGIYLGMLDGKKTNITFRMTLGGVYTQQLQNLASNSFVLFQTRKVTFTLIDSNGNKLEGTASYYDGSWHDFGNGKTGSSMELLPTNYTFKVGYLGATVQKIQNVGTDPNVVFQTVSVSFKLLDSTGRKALDGEADFYSNAWNKFGETGRTGGTMELLPTNYTFKVGYMGAAMQKIQNVGTDPNVVFKTTKVSFKLVNSFGIPIKGDAWFYSNGWYKFGNGSTGSTMELLPVNYTFKVEYDGVANQKLQNVATDARVEFGTRLVTVNLVTKVKVMGLTVKLPVIGGKVSYYAGGWQDMGKTPLAIKQLLPATYPIAVEFMGQRQQVSRSITDDTCIEFEISPELYYQALKKALS